MDDTFDIPTEYLTDAELEECREKPLILFHPCHNQTVERHVKLVTEASALVSGFQRRDGLIRRKIKYRKLKKKLDKRTRLLKSEETKILLWLA